MISPERLRQLRTDGRTGYEAPTQEPAESATKTDEAPTRELELTAPTETPMTTPTKNRPPFQRISTPTVPDYFNRLLRRGQRDDDWLKKRSAPTVTPTETPATPTKKAEATPTNTNRETSPLRLHYDDNKENNNKESDQNKENEERTDAPTFEINKESPNKETNKENHADEENLGALTCTYADTGRPLSDRNRPIPGSDGNPTDTDHTAGIHLHHHEGRGDKERPTGNGPGSAASPSPTTSRHRHQQPHQPHRHRPPIRLPTAHPGLLQPTPMHMHQHQSNKQQHHRHQHARRRKRRGLLRMGPFRLRGHCQIK